MVAFSQMPRLFASWLRLSFAASLVVGCGSGSGTRLPAPAVCTGSPQTATEANSVASISENVDTTCASIAGDINWKNGATGSSCAQPLDCTPVCCPCPNGTHHTAAAWCNQGLCAAPEDVACMVNGTSGLTGCSN